MVLTPDLDIMLQEVKTISKRARLLQDRRVGAGRNKYTIKTILELAERFPNMAEDYLVRKDLTYEQSQERIPLEMRISEEEFKEMHQDFEICLQSVFKDIIELADDAFRYLSKDGRGVENLS